MNTERPDNDARDEDGGVDAAGSAEEQGAARARTPGVTEGDADAPGEEAGAEKTGAEGEDAQAEESTAGGTTASVEGSAPAESTAETGETTDVGATAPVKAPTPAEGSAAAEEPTEVGAAAPVRETEAAEETEVAEASTIAEAPAVADGGAEIPDATPDPGMEEPRPARRRSLLLIASVAAAVLLVGGGGAYLAASASGGSGGRTNAGASGDGTTPPLLALDGYSEGGTNGIAPGEPNPYGVRYEAGGTLPDGPGSAPVYRATGQVTEDEVARLAKALGLDGTPVAQGQAWQVGAAKDGSGPSLVVDRQAPGTWTFHRYAAGTDACQSAITCTKDPANPAVDTVSEAAARKAAAPVLKALGQDDAKVDASQVMGAQRAVNANPLVGGLPTDGWTTGLTVGSQGEVVGGSGQLKAPVKGDTYPVLGARKTLDLMNSAPMTDHRMGIGGCASPVPMKDRLEAPCGQSTSGAGATPAKQTVPVDGAVFGLAVHAVNGRQALVPSWLFRVKGAGAQGGFTVTYPAVDPKYLASNSTTPSGRPTPSATTSGGGPSSAPATRDIKVDSYAADGRNLTVIFTGGVCGDYDAKASESADKVTLTVTETPWKDKVCIMIAKQLTRTVQLDKPLGDRKVVGSDGKVISLPKPGPLRPQATAGVR